MIRLNVFIRTTESNRAEILSVAKELVTASLKDEGCIAYDIFESTCIASFERTCVERLFPFDFATAYLSSSKQQVLSLKRVHVAAKTFNRI